MKSSNFLIILAVCGFKNLTLHALNLNRNIFKGSCEESAFPKAITDIVESYNSSLDNNNATELIDEDPNFFVPENFANISDIVRVMYDGSTKSSRWVSRQDSRKLNSK